MINIIKYEFNEYLDISYNNNIVRVNANDIQLFISNEMTNHLTNITDEYMLWLENYLQQNFP